MAIGCPHNIGLGYCTYFYSAQEYADFCEFLEDELGLEYFRDIVARFEAKEAVENEVAIKQIFPNRTAPEPIKETEQKETPNFHEPE